MYLSWWNVKKFIIFQLCRVLWPCHSAKNFFLKKSNFAECRLEGTRQRIFFLKKNPNFAERRLGALGKEIFLKKIKNLCRVPAGLALGKEIFQKKIKTLLGWHSAKWPSTGPAPWRSLFFAECPRDTRQSLCRVSDKRHSAKRALPINFLPCVLCRVQFGLCRVPQALGKEPKSSSDAWSIK